MGSSSIRLDRTVLLASADASLRQRLRDTLGGLRWNVREAGGGAEAIAQLENRPTEVLLLDDWLPDLDVIELAEQIGALYPGMELLRINGDPIGKGTKSPRHHELLHALREAFGSSLREKVELKIGMSTRRDPGSPTHSFTLQFFRLQPEDLRSRLVSTQSQLPLNSWSALVPACWN